MLDLKEPNNRQMLRQILDNQVTIMGLLKGDRKTMDAILAALKDLATAQQSASNDMGTAFIALEGEIAKLATGPSAQPALDLISQLKSANQAMDDAAKAALATVPAA